MDELKVNLKQWWILLGAGGIVVAGASATKPFIPGFLIGLGLLFFGAGEWANHPIQLKRSGGVTTESYPWNPWHSYCFGLLLDVVGIGLLAFGFCRLVAFGP